MKYFLPVQVSLTVGYEIGHIAEILQNGSSKQGYPKIPMKCK